MKQELVERTRAFALDVVNMIRLFQAGLPAEVISKQLLRAATSVGANYRSALRGKSRRDFIMKLNIAEEEADESCFWLELCKDAGLVESHIVDKVLQEARELTAILTKSGRTAKQNIMRSS